MPDIYIADLPTDGEIGADTIIPHSSGGVTIDKLSAYIRSRILADLAGGVVTVKALKIKIKGGSGYGYIVMESDEDGNLSPTYYTEDEYNALS